MDIKRIWDFLIIFGLALASSWLLNHFFFSSNKEKFEKNATVGFVAPLYEQESKPLNTEVYFVDSKYGAEKKLTEIETDSVYMVFTTEGACLERLEFKPIPGTTEVSLETIFPAAPDDKENRCFLIGCPDKTPFMYQFVDRRDTECTVELEYSAPYDGGVIRKTFTIHKNSYQIDLDIAYEHASTQNPINLRLFYTSPLMPDLGKNDVVASIVGDEKGYLKKTARSSLNINQGWLLPTLFGSDSRYMIHSMVKDHNDFCERAYYKFYDQERMLSVLEGTATAQSNNWKLSFYMGPKVLGAMEAVDSRLDQTLDYSGWFAPVSKFMLALLKFFYGYVHNYGIAIILLTLLIRLLLMPFTMRSEELMKKQAEVGKKLAHIKKRFKDDPDRLAREQMELMKKDGMPGLSGMLPLLLQAPIFYALARVLSSSIELYKAPFAFWITDLSAKDPWYILPILIMIMMLLATRSTRASGQQGVLAFIMPLMLGVFSMFMSAGLALYFFVSTAFGVVQSLVARRLS